MHKLLILAASAALLPCTSTLAQTVVVPIAGVGTELNSSTSYFVNPCLNASCSIRVQYFYAASEFLNQGITAPIVINTVSWRANGGTVHAGGVTHPSLQVQMSTATAGAILAPNPTFATNHGGDLTSVYGPASVTTLATTGSSPNGNIIVLPLSTPFIYDPNAGDLVVDCSNQGGVAGTGLNHDQTTLAGALGARIWDFTPNATVQTPASGNNQPGIVIQMELGYTPVSGAFAQKSKYGNDCYDCYASVYENFGTAASFDLNGSSMRGNFGAAYAFTPGAAYTAPTAAATPLALGDDTQVTVILPFGFPMPCGAAPLTQFQVCSNGYISTASNGTAFTPSVSAALGFANTSWGVWHDFNPGAAGSGAVKTEVESGTGAFVVTWDGVFDFGGTTPNFWQMAFYPNGNVEYRFQTMSAAGGTGFLVYYSPAGPNADPGNRDISSTLAAGFAVCCTDTSGLDLDASARPVSGTTIQLNTSNVPATASLSVVLVNFAALVPGLELSGLGMPGCYQNIGLFGAVTLGLNVGPASWSQPFGIPLSSSYYGTNVFGQSAALVPGVNPLGAVSSNGLRLLVGNL